MLIDRTQQKEIICLEAGYRPPVFDGRGILTTETTKLRKAGGSPPLNEVGF
jgi:hypothetical protein